MIGQILVAIAAGCASAAMFASITSGALLSLVLLYLSPLPLMVAALSWGSGLAAIGSIIAAIGLGAIFGLADLIGFAVAVALPACWLGHLSLLGRPAAANHTATAVAPSALDWYPVGRLLLWIVGFAVFATGAALLTLGTDASAIAGTLRNFLLRVLELNEAAISPETDQWVEAMVRFAPPAAAIAATLILSLNLFLAAKITATSGRLVRPWPDLRAMALPPMTPVALCVAIAFCFSGGLLAIVAKVVSSALIIAYALIGFAVLHTITRALKSRALWLGSAYIFALAFGWPMLALAALGLADALFGLRQRYLRTHPPPLPVP
jgi:hypothetical protein